MASKKIKKTPTAPSSGGVTGSPMDVRLLENLVKLMAANDLNTVDLRDGLKRVVLKRGPAVMSPPSGVTYAPAPLPPPQPPAGSGASDAPKGSGPAVSEPAGLVPIKSPMVGTFYSAPKPGEKAFVAVGSRVTKDETDVCIIEAMKTFNVHKSEISGTIAKTLITDGQTVQFDQPLFLVKPD